MGKNVAIAHTPPYSLLYRDLDKGPKPLKHRPLHPGRAKGCELCKDLIIQRRRYYQQKAYRDGVKAKKNKELEDGTS